MNDGLELFCDMDETRIWGEPKIRTSLPFCNLEVVPESNLGYNFCRKEWAEIPRLILCVKRCRPMINDPESVLEHFSGVNFYMKFINYTENGIHSVRIKYKLLSSNPEALMMLKLAYGGHNE